MPLRNKKARAVESSRGLIDVKACIDFIQGLAILLINVRTTELIMKCKIKMIILRGIAKRIVVS